MSHAAEATKFHQNKDRVAWHDKSLWHVREKRDKEAHKFPHWEALRTTAASIKDNVLANLDTYLLEFEKNAQANGVKVHWAKDATEHNKIVLDILREKQVTQMVKSKSMLTEECHLNPYLEKNGVEVVDTDLGERIIQLNNEAPSHIVMPAIHKKKEEISEIFHRHYHTEEGNSDPAYLTNSAREKLRQNFMGSKVALSGVNFGIAETGGVVVCTNEGNADMGIHLADVHIASMGMEKLIPKLNHLSIFLRLLARSATGQPITTYSSHFHKPREDSEMHIIIVDNGRSTHLGKPDYRASLRCIRCGACMNTCPVYRRSGGHSYDYTVPGPIGAILAPHRDMKKYSSLPFASTLCGSCSDVCPVKIDIHEQLYKWRQDIAKSGYVDSGKTWGMKIGGFVLANKAIYMIAGKIARWSLMYLPKWMIYNKLNAWGTYRDLPEPPKQSFKEWYKKQQNNGQR